MPNRWVFVAAAGAVALFAACLDFGDLSGSDEADASVDAGTNKCGASQKECVGACVEQTDPSVGCSGACNACSSPPNVEPACALQNNTEVCSTGKCNPQYGDCDTDPSNGCETHTTTSANCGNCGTQCGTQFCELQSSGAYACSATCDLPSKVCVTDAGSQCAAVASDTDNCGTCGTSCAVANGSGTCVNGSCALACNAGYFACGGKCVLPSATHCGASCKACTGGTSCDDQVGSTTYGMCTNSGSGIADCGAGVAACPVSGGTCTTNLSEDPNCGECGVNCGANGEQCCGVKQGLATVYHCILEDSGSGGVGMACPP